MDIYIPLEITENLDILNSKSGYYNDICYTSTSDFGTDISLKDRRVEYINNNKSVCQDDCDFDKYNNVNKQVKCSCKVKICPSSFKDIFIDKKKLYKNFVDIKNIANIDIIVCYKQLFTRKGISNNLGFFITLVIILFHLISFVTFYLKGYNYIIDNINLIKNNKQNLNILNENEKQFSPNNNNSNKIFDNNINDKDKDNKTKFNLGNFPPKKKKRKIKIINNNITNNFNNKNESNLINNSKKEQLIIQELSKERINKTINLESDKKEANKEYIDNEINDLPYDLAIKYDKRTYLIYYCSLLKTKHKLIFSFFNCNDYNSNIIKIDQFIISFVIYYTVNALFFEDDTMHKIYKSKGSFNLEYQIPIIIYSTLISVVLNTLLGMLALSNNAIINFKNNKKNDDIIKREQSLIFKLKIKFISYFILGFIFLLFFWYYLSVFSAIYKNTQIHLIKDTIISFCISLIYPLVIYLLPGIFRIPALSDDKVKRICMYKISKILQIL